MQTDTEKQSSQVRIRKARHSDLDTLKKVAARAYDKDPFANWVVLQDGNRTRRMEKFFEVYFKDYGMRYDHVFTTDELNGSTIWYPPEPQDCWRISTLKHISLLHKWIFISGIRNIPSLLVDAEKVNALHLKERHYFLHVINVDPIHQGQGIGGHLLRHGLQMCNEGGVPAYLETATEENVRYYQKHNFRVSEKVVLSRGLKVWGMIYEPKSNGRKGSSGSRGRLPAPSSHATVRTDRYTAVHEEHASLQCSSRRLSRPKRRKADVGMAWCM